MTKRISPMIDEEKVARFLAAKEAVIEAQIAAEVEAEKVGREYLPGTDMPIIGTGGKAKPKAVDRTTETKLYDEFDER